MRVRAAVGLAVLLACVSGCGGQGGAAAPEASPLSSPSSLATSARPSSLSAAELGLARRIARQQQRRVTGTLVGATAFVTRGTPFDPGPLCDSVSRVLTIRLVWTSDADFTHNHPPSDPPDGHRKQIFIAADAANGRICAVGSDYRRTGPGPGETLLFGRWPVTTTHG